MLTPSALCLPPPMFSFCSSTFIFCAKENSATDSAASNVVSFFMGNVFSWLKIEIVLAIEQFLCQVFLFDLGHSTAYDELHRIGCIYVYRPYALGRNDDEVAGDGI